MKGNIVFVGAGGTGMSGLVSMIYALGFENIVAIDAVQSELTDKLVAKGINVKIGHGKYEIQVDDHVIYSESCVHSSEVQTAKNFKRTNKQQKLVVNYFQFLGEISKYFQTIGVMGTNGKSTTTAMLLTIAKDILPNFGLGILGALVADLGNESYVIADKKTADIKNIFDYVFTGKGLDYDLVKKYIFIVEACEYKRHFLHLDLDYVLLTSLELDHTDYFEDFEDYKLAFSQVFQKLRYQCFALQDYNFTDTTPHLDKKIEIIPTKKYCFEYIFGEFQNGNASLVERILEELLSSQERGKVKNDIHSLVKNFHGLRRRMEKIKITEKGTIIFSDYGHVASSIQLGKKALQKAFPEKKLHVVFQPHQISRIANNWDEFPDAFMEYETKIIFDIYAARESMDLVKTLGVETFQDLQTKQDLGNVFAKHIGGKYTEDFNDVKKLVSDLGSDDILVVYSAGDIDYQLRKYLLNN